MNSLMSSTKLIFVNIDEVPVNFDMTGKSTYDFQGKKNIETIQTKGIHMRVTLVLGVTSLGRFFPPFFIFKSNNK